MDGGLESREGVRENYESSALGDYHQCRFIRDGLLISMCNGNNRNYQSEESEAQHPGLNQVLARRAKIISFLMLAGALPWEGAAVVVPWFYGSKAVILVVVVAMATATAMPRFARTLAWGSIVVASAVAVFGILNVGLGSRAWLAWLGCGFAVAGGWEIARKRSGSQKEGGREPPP